MGTGIIGYKQNYEYFDTYPNISDEKIVNISSIIKSRYSPSDKKTTDINEFLKRPIRYNINFLTRKKELSTLSRHCCYFTKEQDAKKIYKKLKLQQYDQVTKPFLDKLDNNKKLSKLDEYKLLKIINELTDNK